MKLFEFFNVPKQEKSRVDNQGNQPDDQELTDQLFWFIIDNDELHKRHVLPFVKNYRQQIMNKKYSRDKFKKYLVPMIDRGCDLFLKDKKLTKNPSKLFNNELRDSICSRVLDEIIASIQNDAVNIRDHKL